jgi:hypothetical protein
MKTAKRDNHLPSTVALVSFSLTNRRSAEHAYSVNGTW